MGGSVAVGDERDDDFNQGTWISLLGLLHWNEFFVTVDNTTLWRSHIAWAKPKGKDIKDYTTQRFATNMVFLSLLLGAEMNVLFNAFTAEIRHAMMNEEYHNLKFYIGCLLVVGPCITVLGLVTTFTAWGMISAISDSNSHCLLRSSMGQYVTSLPSRFAVAALYLFLSILMLLIVEMMSGPVKFAMLFLILFLFLQVVVSLSAFGRLIIHTGAMGRKRVLDPEFERHLLPSGLHASLLIKATDRRQRRTNAVAQYRPESQKTRQDSSASAAARRRQNSNASTGSSGRSSNFSSDGQSSRQITEDDAQRIHSSAKAFSGPTDPTIPSWEDIHAPSPIHHRGTPGHRRDDSTESVESVDEMINDVKFPRPSVLNKTGSADLKQFVEMTLSQGANLDATELVEEARNADQRASFSGAPRTNTSSATPPPIEEDTPQTQIRKMASRRQSAALVRRGGTRRVMQEWAVEDDVRSMYDITPPVAIWEDEDDPDAYSESDMVRMPRASLLNRHRGFNSLRDFVTGYQDNTSSDLSTVQEETGTSGELAERKSSNGDYDTFDSNNASDTLSQPNEVDEETGEDASLSQNDGKAGSEVQHLLGKATRRMFRSRGGR